MQTLCAHATEVVQEMPPAYPDDGMAYGVVDNSGENLTVGDVQRIQDDSTATIVGTVLGVRDELSTQMRTMSEGSEGSGSESDADESDTSTVMLDGTQFAELVTYVRWTNSIGLMMMICLAVQVGLSVWEQLTKRWG